MRLLIWSPPARSRHRRRGILLRLWLPVSYGKKSVCDGSCEAPHILEVSRSLKDAAGYCKVGIVIFLGQINLRLRGSKHLFSGLDLRRILVRQPKHIIHNVRKCGLSRFRRPAERRIRLPAQCIIEHRFQGLYLLPQHDFFFKKACIFLFEP